MLFARGYKTEEDFSVVATAVDTTISAFTSTAFDSRDAIISTNYPALDVIILNLSVDNESNYSLVCSNPIMSISGNTITPPIIYDAENSYNITVNVVTKKGTRQIAATVYTNNNGQYRTINLIGWNNQSLAEHVRSQIDTRVATALAISGGIVTSSMINIFVNPDTNTFAYPILDANSNPVNMLVAYDYLTMGDPPIYVASTGYEYTYGVGFSSIPYGGNPNYTWNTAQWLYGVDLTFYCPYTVQPYAADYPGGYTGSNTGSQGILITPRHVLCANHVGCISGQIWRFVDKNGNSHSIPQVSFYSLGYLTGITSTGQSFAQKYRNDGSSYISDVTIVELASEVPSTVTPAILPPANWRNYFPTLYKADGGGVATGLGYNVPVVTTNQFHQLHIHNWGGYAPEYSSGDSSLVATSPDDYPDGLNTSRALFFTKIIGGDSGHPLFIIVNFPAGATCGSGPKAVVMSDWHYINPTTPFTTGFNSSNPYWASGPHVGDYVTDINIALTLTSLNATGSVHQLTLADFSSWPFYS